jgi:hypothetical protein
MEQGRIFDILVGTREDVAAIKTSVEDLRKSIDSLNKRVAALEQKPVQRINTGVTAAISSIIGAMVAFLVSLLREGVK